MTGYMLVIIPSRGRPERLAEAINAGLQNARGDVHYAIGLDSDDTELENYQRVIGAFNPNRVKTFIGRDRQNLVQWTNLLAGDYAARYRYLASFGDDHVPVTPGWDVLLTNAIRDMGGTGFSYPDDKRRSDIPEAVVMSSDIVLALGWMACPYMAHFWIDNVWSDLGKGIDRIRFVSESVVTHKHYLVDSTVERDVTYAEAEAKSNHKDAESYTTWTRFERAANISTLKELL